MVKQNILKKKYSDQRKIKPELKFRFLYRAQVVKDASLTYIGTLSNLKILDLGSADGKTLIAMDQFFQNCSFTGVEFSKELLQEVTTLPKNIELFCGDITDLPKFLHEESFDIVSALAVLEHLNNPEDALEAAYQKVKKGGLFVATVPVPAWDSISTALKLLPNDQHELRINKKRLIRMVENAGFKILIYKKFMWAPISFLPYLHIQVSQEYASNIDNRLYPIKIFNWLFVNQLIIGEKK